jgi:hypothetical protein
MGQAQFFRLERDEIRLDRCQSRGVIPAKAGIHLEARRGTPGERWMPAFAGMTSRSG